MVAILRTMLIALVFVPRVGLPQSANHERDADIARFLSAIKYVPALKHGMRSVPVSQRHSSAMIEKILKLSDKDIMSAVLPVFRKDFTPQEAKAAAEFYSSDTGQAIIKQLYAAVDNPHPAISLTPTQRAQYEIFAATSAGSAVKHLLALEHTAAFNNQIMMAVIAAAQK